jgi:hypothetical protein
MPQQSRRALAYVRAFLAYHYGRLSVVHPSPVFYLSKGAADGRRNEMRIGLEILLRSDVNQHGALRRADKSNQFVD